MVGELWKQITGYEGKYEVSNLGRIRSFRYAGKGWDKFKNTPIILSFGFTGNYRMVCLCCRNVCKPFTVHKLVAQEFIGKRPVGMEVNHKDGNKLNNHIDNLEYVTRKENVLHALKNGLCSGIKLTEGKVLKIIQMGAMGFTEPQIGKKFGISRSNVGSIIRRETWKYLDTTP